MPIRAADLLLAAAAILAAGGVAAVGSKAPQLPLSAKQCWEPPAPAGTPADARPAWCQVTNLYLYRGGAYYLSKDAGEALPTVQYGTRTPVPQVLTPAAFRALLAPGAAALPVGRAFLMRSGVQGPACSREGSYVNFGDGMTERITTLWMFLCDVMGHCSYNDRSRLQLIDAAPRACRPHDPPSARDAYPGWYRQVMGCMSDQPLRHINGSWRESVVHVGTAWLGLGQRCRSHYGHCHDGSRGKLGPTPALLGGWRETLGRCLGFPTQAHAPLAPVRVLIVDRAYESHRHLLNVNTLLRTLRRRYSPARVRVALQYMEDLSVAEQFRLVAQQTVLVHVHGSNIGHWQGLPHGAVVVKIAPYINTYADQAYGDYLARDYGPVSNLTWLPLVNSDPNYLHLATEQRSLGDPRYAAFSDADKLALLRADCAALAGAARRKICSRAVKFNLNLVVQPERLEEVVDVAIKQAFAKQGRAVPHDWLAGKGEAGAGEAAGGGGPEAADTGGQQQGQAEQQQQGQAEQQQQEQQQQEQAQQQPRQHGKEQQQAQQQAQGREQQQPRQQLLGQLGAVARGRLHPPSVVVGAAAASGLFLLHRRWLQLLTGRRKALPGPGAASLFSK